MWIWHQQFRRIAVNITLVFSEYTSKHSPAQGHWYSFWGRYILYKRCATSRKVPGSIPGGVTGFFSDTFPSYRTMALGSTQPLVKMSTRNIPGVKDGQCVRLTTYHHTVQLSRNLGALTSKTPLGLRWPVTGVLYFTSYIYSVQN